MHSKKVLLTLSLLATLLIAPLAHAGMYANQLGQCLVQSTSNQDKQQLMSWLYAEISLNHAISQYSNITAHQRNQINQNTAELFERLIGKDCNKQAKAAIKYEGPTSFKIAFQILGKVAMRQLLQAPEMKAGLKNFSSRIDTKALKKELGVK